MLNSGKSLKLRSHRLRGERLNSVRREYFTLTIAGTVTMLSGGMSFPIFAPYVSREFTAPIVLVGLAVSGYFVLRMFTELPFGAISDKIGPRKPLLLGRVLATLGAFMSWVATDVYQLIVARALWGVGDAAFFCISIAYVASLFSGNERGKAIGTFQAVEMIGSFAGQSMGGIIATAIGIRNIFLLNSVLGVVALALVMPIGGQKGSSGVLSVRSIFPSRTMMRSVINSTVLIACLMNFSVVFRNNGIISTLLPIYYTTELDFTLAEYSLLMASSTAGAAIGTVSGGALSDRFERKKVIALGFGLGIIATSLLGMVTQLILLFPVMALNGFFWGIIYSVTPALVADSVPETVRGAAVGTYRTFFDFGGLVGPVAMSVVAQLAGLPYGYFVSFYLGAALMLANLPLATLLKAKRED